MSVPRSQFVVIGNVKYNKIRSADEIIMAKKFFAQEFCISKEDNPLSFSLFNATLLYLNMLM